MPALFVGDPGPLDINSWFQAPRAEARGRKVRPQDSCSPESPSLTPDSLLPVSKVYCEGGVCQSVDFSCFWSPFKSTNVYALFYIIIYYVHMPLLLVHRL